MISASSTGHTSTISISLTCHQQYHYIRLSAEWIGHVGFLSGWSITAGFIQRVRGSTNMCDINSLYHCHCHHRWLAIQTSVAQYLRAVMPCGWGVKAGMVCVWVAGKTVWSVRYTLARSERFEVVVHDDKALYKYQISFFTFFAYLGCKGGNQSYRDKFCIEYSSIAECWECGRVMRCCLSTECCVTVDPADCYNVLVITGPGTESCMCKCLLLCVSQAQEFYSLQ